MRNKKTVLILIFLLLVVVAIFRPIKMYQDEHQKAQRLQVEIQGVKKENDSLRLSPTEKERILAEVDRLFGNHSQEAKKIIGCENSSMDMAHVNRNRDGSFDTGPFQINTVHSKRFGTGFMVDAVENVRVAYQLWKEQGFAPWYSSHVCHHLS